MLSTDELREVEDRRILKPGTFTRVAQESSRLPQAQKAICKKHVIQGEIDRAFFCRAPEIREKMKNMTNDLGNILRPGSLSNLRIPAFSSLRVAE